MNNPNAERQLKERIDALRITTPDMTFARARVVARRQLAEGAGTTWLVPFDEVEHLTAEEQRAYMAQFPFDKDRNPTIRFSDDDERARAAEATNAALMTGALARQEERHRTGRVQRSRTPFEEAWQQDLNRFGPDGALVYGMSVDDRLRNAAASASSPEEAARFREAVGYKAPTTSGSWFDSLDVEAGDEG